MDVKFPDISILRQLARDQLVSHLENVSIRFWYQVQPCLFIADFPISPNRCFYYRPFATPTVSNKNYACTINFFCYTFMRFVVNKVLLMDIAMCYSCEVRNGHFTASFLSTSDLRKNKM